MNIRKFPARQFAYLFENPEDGLTYEKDFRVKAGMAAVDMDEDTYCDMSDEDLLILIKTKCRVLSAVRNSATLEYLNRKDFARWKALKN